MYTRQNSFIPSGLLKRLDFYLALSLVGSGWIGSVRAANNSESNPETLWEAERFSAEVLDTGLTRPMELDVDEDGVIYFIELDGNLKRLAPDSSESEVIGTIEVFAGQENGLIGLALDPDFEQNRRLFLQYSPVDYTGQHVSRFELDESGQLDMESETLILKFEEQRDDCCHHAGSLEFGPDGNLFIATGDNTHPGGDSGGYAPLDEREGRHAYDAQDSAGNTMDLRGKILRIRPLEQGGYSIPEGNLFPAGSDQGRPEIYVMGCRNPWRIQVDPATGYLYWGEVGPDAGGEGPRGPRGYDEVNQARSAGNFGWPFFVGANFAYADYDYLTKEVGPLYDPLKPENRSPTNTGARFLPPAQPAWIYYPYASSKEFPEVGSGGRTACAGPVFHYQASTNRPFQFPKSMDNCMLFYDWQRPLFMVAELSPGSDIQSITPFPSPIALKRPIDMVFGPDGALLVLDYGATWGVNEDSKLVKIKYYSGNRPPVASFKVEPSEGPAPLNLKIDASASGDPDSGDQLTYTWEWLPDAGVAPAGAVSRLELDQPGEYQLKLTVTDTSGVSDQAYARVVVGNSRPVISVNNPAASGNLVDMTQAQIFQISIKDPEEGTSEENAAIFENRVFSRLIPIQGSIPDSPEKLLQEGHFQGNSAALAKIQNSDCLNCHAVQKRVIGPGFNEIADRYKEDSEALERAVLRVKQGSTGVWGEIPMLPHENLAEETIREMVGWILDRSSRETQGGWASGLEVHWNPGENDKQETLASLGGIIAIEARYTDYGSTEAPPLTGEAFQIWRSNVMQAEDFSSRKGTQTLSSESAQGGQFIGDIQNGSYLIFNQIHWGDLTRFTAQVASPDTGGKIELRVGGPDGELLKSFTFEPTGEWENWTEIGGELPTLEQNQPISICVIFLHPQGKSGGFMNMDSFRFEK